MRDPKTGRFLPNKAKVTEVEDLQKQLKCQFDKAERYSRSIDDAGKIIDMLENSLKAETARRKQLEFWNWVLIGLAAAELIALAILA